MRTLADQLDVLSRELDDKTAELSQLETNAIDAKRVYEVAYARAFLDRGNTGTVDDRKQRAALNTAEERYTADIAAAHVRACKEAIKALHVRIDVGRTLASNARAEAALAGGTP